MINQTLSDSELEVMNVIWEKAVPMSISELLEYFSETKGWKTQTISTFATRLVVKGFLTVNKVKKTNLYSAYVTKIEYENSLARKLIDSSYSGSIKKMFVSLFDGNEISKNELDEIREWLDKLD